MKKRILCILCVCVAAVLFIGNGMTALADSISPKDDFYEAVNGEWLASAVIPADRPSVGGFMDISDDVEETLTKDFTAMLRGEKQPDKALTHFLEFYRLALDFEARDAAGAEPLLPYMEMVERLENLADFSDQWAQWDLLGMPAPFSAGVMADMGDASVNALYISAPGLFLMDKSYYADETTKDMLQSAYAQMSATLLVMAGKTEDEAEQIVRQALAFDESLVPYIKSAEESSDYTKLYNPMDFSEFDAQIDCMDFAASFTELLGSVPRTIVSTDPDYFSALNKLVNEETFPAMKSWMLVSTVNSLARCLSDDFRVESGSFARMLTGTSEAPSPEKGAYSLASGMFGEVVGIYYGQTYFGEQAKQDVRKMVETILATYENRLSANTWLGADTRATAIKKLETMAIHVGFPDEPRPLYGQMLTVPSAEGGTLVGNSMAFTRLSKLDNYSKWNTPVDRSLWPLSADTVNAMYSPLDNSINFPAAILQAPFYSLEQSSSANFGGIGTIIAHEISHAFDPNGAKFDELGNLANWWTAEDHDTFDALSQAMEAAFDGIQYAGGVVNGALTVAENVADAGGLACALEAAKLDADADLTAFFTNWAVIWRQKSTPEYEALLLQLDVHAPNKLRANIQLQNTDDFHTTFDIQPGDGMYRSPEERVAIW